MADFSQEQGALALLNLCRIKFHRPDALVTNADLIVFGWIATEAVRRNSNPFTTCPADMNNGFLAVGGQPVAPVGTSRPTLIDVLKRLQEWGVIEVSDTKSAWSARGIQRRITIHEDFF